MLALYYMVKDQKHISDPSEWWVKSEKHLPLTAFYKTFNWGFVIKTMWICLGKHHGVVILD